MKQFLMTLIGSSFLIIASDVVADQVILDDLIVDGSACIGFDCVNGESFGFDTIRIKENNLRIRAVDTSSSASFPTRDWQITFNDSANGGANKFSIDDIDGGRTPFTIEAGAPNFSLYVDDAGRVGLGTSVPITQLHVKASAGGATPRMLFENPDAIGGNYKWFFDVKDGRGDFRISRVLSGQQEFKLTASGSITIPGNFISGGTTLNVPDYVFEPGYPLLPLDELSSFIEREKHLPNVPSAKEINQGGINMTAFQMKLLEKVEELTLYMVAQEQTIRELKERLEGIESTKN